MSVASRCDRAAVSDRTRAGSLVTRRSRRRAWRERDLRESSARSFALVLASASASAAASTPPRRISRRPRAARRRRCHVESSSWAACRPAPRTDDVVTITIARRDEPRARAQPRRADRRGAARPRARGAVAGAERAAAERQRARLRNAAADQPGGVRLRSASAGLRQRPDASSVPSTCSTRASTLSQAVVDLARDERRAGGGAQRRGGAIHVQERARSRRPRRRQRCTCRRSPRSRASSRRARSSRPPQALYNQAVDLKQGGLVAGIDVLRAEVQLSAETQRATTAANDAEKAKLQLARVIGCRSVRPSRSIRRCPSCRART